MTLQDLVGLRVFDARGEYVRAKDESDSWRDEDSRVELFRIDGIVYAVQEDPDDGYRSSMREIRVADEQDSKALLAEFAPMVCMFRHRTKSNYGGYEDDILFAVNEATNLMVLEVGTSNVDDYYPNFECHWTPEGVPVPVAPDEAQP